MRDWGIAGAVSGAVFIFFGRYYAWCYGEGLGKWALRMFVGMSKLGIALLPIGLVLLALSVVV